MDQNNDDAGLQFVLDNRRLILGFGMLVVLCGGFFVLGFVEGRRQCAGSSTAATVQSGVPTAGVANLSPAGNPEPEGAKAPDDKAVQERMDWYSQVGSASRAKREAPPREGAPKPAGAAAQAGAVPKQAVGATPSSGATSYTVQVGAFRQRKEAEAKAAVLKAKGYEYSIDAPKSPDQLYLLKVGRFASRAEAVSLQLRLRRDGFSTFIKTN